MNNFKLSQALSATLLLALSACNTPTASAPAAKLTEAAPEQSERVSVNKANLVVKDASGSVIGYYLDGAGQRARLLLTNGLVASYNMWTGAFLSDGAYMSFASANCAGTGLMQPAGASTSFAPNEVALIDGHYFKITAYNGSSSIASYMKADGTCTNFSGANIAKYGYTEISPSEIPSFSGALEVDAE